MISLHLYNVLFAGFSVHLHVYIDENNDQVQ